MPHIHTNPGEHDHTVSAYIIRLDFNEPKIMLHLHKKVHVYLNFGGHIEINENPWQAIEHEILEESGYEINQLKVLQPKNRIKRLTDNLLHPTPLTYGTHDISEIAESTHLHTDSSFVFVTNEPPAHKIPAGESQDIIILSRDEIANHDNVGLFVKEASKYIFEEVLPNWEQVDTAEFKD